MRALTLVAAGWALLGQADPAPRWTQVFAVEDDFAARRFESVDDVETGGFLAYRTEKGVAVLHARTGKVLGLFPSVQGCRISPGARFLLLLTGESKVRILRCEDAAVTGEFPVPGRGGFEVAFSPDGALAATSSGLLVRLVDGSIAAQFKLSASRVSFSPDGKWLALDEHLFDVAAGKPARSLPPREWGPVWKEALKKNAEQADRMAAASEQRAPVEAEKMREAARLLRSDAPPARIDLRASGFLPDGTFAMSALLIPDRPSGNPYVYAAPLTALFEPGSGTLRSTVPISGSALQGSLLLVERWPRPGPADPMPSLEGLEAVELPSGKSLGLLPLGAGCSGLKRLRGSGSLLALEGLRRTAQDSLRRSMLYAAEPLPAAAAIPARARALLQSYEALRQAAAAANPSPETLTRALAEAQEQEKTWRLLLARGLVEAMAPALRRTRTDTRAWLTIAAKLEETEPAAGAALKAALLDDFVEEAPKLPLGAFAEAGPILAELSAAQKEKVRQGVSAAIAALPKWQEDLLSGPPADLLLPPAVEHVGKLLTQALEEAMKAGAAERAAVLLAAAKGFNPELFAAQVKAVNAALDQKIKDAGTQPEKLAAAAHAVRKLEEAGVTVQGKTQLLRQTCEMHLARGDAEAARKSTQELQALDPAGAAAFRERIERLARAGDALKGAYAAIEKGAHADALAIAKTLEKDDPIRFATLRRRIAALDSFKKAGGDEGLKAVAAAGAWLARHQTPEGVWSADAPCECPSKKPPAYQADYAVGLTGMAVATLALAGHAPCSTETLGTRTAGNVLDTATKTLVALQNPGTGQIGKDMKAHVYATWGLVEAFRSGAEIRPAVELAVKYLVEARNPKAGWRYSYRCQDNDAHMTGVAGIALQRARDAGIEVPKELFAEVEKWFDQTTRDTTPPVQPGQPKPKPKKNVGYAHAGGALNKVFMPGVNENYPWTPGLTSLGLAYKTPLGRKDPALALSITSFPVAAGADKADFFYALWGSYAMSLQGTTDARDWLKQTKDVLLRSQSKTACSAGSWDPVSKWAPVGGRLYETVSGAMALEFALGAK